MRLTATPPTDEIKEASLNEALKLLRGLTPLAIHPVLFSSDENPVLFSSDENAFP